MALTKIDDRGVTYPLDLLDNEKIRFGTGSDLEIYHDGTNTYIKHVTAGAVYIDTTTNLNLRVNSSETAILANGNGSVELRYDDVKKLETISGGISVTGNVDCDGIRMLDSDEIRLGTGDDLKLWHNGTNSFVHHDNGSGWLYLQGDAIGLRTKSDNNETYLTCSHNGGVSLYFDNSKKLETTTQGIQFIDNDTNLHLQLTTSDGTQGYIWAGSDDVRILTGGGEYAFIANKDGAVELYYDNSLQFKTTANGCQIDGDLYFDNEVNAGRDLFWDQSADYLKFSDNTKAVFGNGTDLQIYHDGSNTTIHNATGTTVFRADELHFNNAANTENKIKAVNNGQVELYYDNSKKVETYSSGIKLNGTSNVWLQDSGKLVCGGGSDLQIYHDGTHSYLRDNGTSHLRIENDNIRLRNGGSSETMLAATVNDNVSLYYDNSKKFYTTANGTRCDDDVKLSVGTGGDMNIYHDGTHSYIKNSTGYLLLESDQLQLRAANGETYFNGIANGAAELYYNDAKKLETTSAGAIITAGGVPNTALDSSPVKLVLHDETDHNWDHNEHCGAIIFRKGTGDEASNTNNIVSAITATHTRTGTGMSNEDGGIQIWTSPSANPTVPLCRWEFDHDGNLRSNGGYIVVNSEPDDRDEGQILLHARATADDNDLVWIGTRDTSSSNYKFIVDGDGELRTNSAHFAGVQRNDANSPTNHFNTADRIRYSAFRGTSDNANYRARMVVGTASADWDDFRVFYYVDAQDDAAVDYDQDQTISFSGSGRGNFKSNVWSGRVESDEGSPNSVYAGAERGFAAFADDVTDQSTCMARNVADGSHVYYSEVNNEANFSVTAAGEVKADDTDSLSQADYAESFEWTDGNTSNQERRGMTVVLDGEKVKLATDSDNKDNIIGVVSPNPAVLGDSAALGWHGRYKRDIYGTPIRKSQEWLVWRKEYTYVDGVKTLCAQPDPTNPKTLDPADVERVKVEDIEKLKAKNLIPDFAITNNIRYTSYAKDIDTTNYDPTRAYIPRKDRKEWDAIGMVGKLVVRRGQPVGTRWLLMKENIGTDTDGTVLDRYLVR